MGWCFNFSTKTWTIISKVSNLIAGGVMIAMAILWYLFRSSKKKYSMLECNLFFIIKK